MKKTEYFLSSRMEYTLCQKALDDVKAKRDNFLSTNSLEIGQIDAERIDYITLNGGGQIQAIITLSYYLKNEAR